MKCKLCHKDKTPKPNTHYLSDFIIKTALNEDGSTIRNRGLIFSIDSQKGYIDFKFQQVSSEKIEEVLGRPSTEDENEDAKKRYDFAVSNSFCYDCEDKFTRIEVEFDNKLLKRFRGSDLTNIESIVFSKEESKILRIFFLLQFWRISVCEYTFVLPENISEFLRIKILNYDLNDLEILPLAITYLETLPEVNKEDEGNKYKTGNMVNPVEGNNPYLIIMNDFILQMYDTVDFNFFDFHQLNDPNDFKVFLNHQEVEFKIKVFSDSKRREFINKLTSLNLAKPILSIVKKDFYLRFVKEFAKLPSDYEVAIYGTDLMNTKEKHILIKEKLDRFNEAYFKELGKKHKKKI